MEPKLKMEELGLGILNFLNWDLKGHLRSELRSFDMYELVEG